MSEKENKALKHPTVKCHGKFKTSIKVNAGKGEVVIDFIADQSTLDLNQLGRILRDGATAIFVSDQTEFPLDDEKDKKKDDDKPKEAKGQLSLLKVENNEY
ncbi:hypothetical protein [Lactobacillus crispatus]|nr:hypothetical protein [Lactobacillus crispatus]MCZ3847174.1 hypothetical protein [Lactobacillus crispatus]MCZ3849436.1 hypothetical protein [Lactobacillus crispatus]MCZ3855372.1 hypothetical protein [Lactobacillus crispatus]MCZ3857555.1 hypothetical protein [Lactobacillus crispatus]MCZ3859883.1 hypothetical protein [Lactobacillus crispatus]